MTDDNSNKLGAGAYTFSRPNKERMPVMIAIEPPTEEERKNVLEETRVARSDQRLLHDAADLW